MKKLTFFFFFLIITTSVCFSQNKITQTREASGFNSIELKMWATVNVTQENHFSVQVTGTQEWLNKISTEVEDNTLIIRIEDDWSKEWTTTKPDITINVSLPKPNHLEVRGSGSIKAQNNFLTDFLSLEVYGSGEMELKDYKAMKVQTGVYGSGKILKDKVVAEAWVAEIQGSGSISAASVMSNIVSLSLIGSGDFNVNQLSAEKLEVSQSGSGNIKLGNGTASDILLENNGSGNILALNVVGKVVSASMEGSGSISIGVLDAFGASVTGSGSVNYHGNPSNVSKNVNGSGRVKQM